MKFSAVVNRFGMFVLLGFATLSGVLPAASQSLPRVFQLDAKVLAAQRAHPDPELLKLAQAGANSALKVPPQTIVNKTKTPPSGDKHDYMSMAR